MARKPVTDLSAWPSITLEGNLIAPAMVAAIASPRDDETTRLSYRIRKGLSIRDEISTSFRVGQSHYEAFSKHQNPSVAATRAFVREFLEETLGFDDLEPQEGPVAFLAGGRVPVVVIPPDERLDRKSPTLSTDRTRSAAFALQDYLNHHEHCLWGLATNGTVIRLMRDNASLTRPAFIEADLAQIFTNEDVASFSVLWLLFHRTRFGKSGAAPADCPLEQWREAGSREGAAARDRLAQQVKEALQILGSGFLQANPELASRLHTGRLGLTEWFNELLRLVYRLIFLMVAEDRNLLHPPRASAAARNLYAEGYSLTALRNLCTRRSAWDRYYDRYEGIKIVFRALARGESTLALPALGGLFAEDNLPHLETARLPNSAFMEALYRLAWLPDSSGIVPVNWRAMETEELGSVYESLLELQPQLGSDGKTLLFASDAAEQRGNQRKMTGSYYTPDSLVQALLDTALDPVLDKAETESDNPVKALLDLRIIDPACGSGHFLLAAARRIATRVARWRADGTPGAEDFRHALRDVARHCIHGVDRNPMAVELTKVALWIETVDPGLPLGFFDAQIRCGDALLGIFDLDVLEKGIPDEAYKPLTGDDKTTCKHYAQVNKEAKRGQGELDFGQKADSRLAAKPLAADFSGFRDLPEDNLNDIAEKAARYRELRSRPTYVRAFAACDLYVAAFLLPKQGQPATLDQRTVPTTEELWAVLNHGKLRESIADAPEVARRAHAFHWPLEFPDVMLQRGGFDVVIGNPPWERIKLQEQEFFANRCPEIVEAKNKAERTQRIQWLAQGILRSRLLNAGAPLPPSEQEIALYREFEFQKRLAEATSEFVRIPAKEGGRFPLTGRGDVNTYALFSELFARLYRQRAGIIVPTGIATDATTAPFFASLVEEKRLARLVDFENSAPMFQSVHRSFKFSLLTLGQNESEAHFAFFLTDPAQLADPERNFTLSPEAIARLNPNTRTAPVFRSRADAELTAKIYEHAPVLIDETKGAEGNPWGITFMAMFHMANDSYLFHTPGDLQRDGWIKDGTDWVKGTLRVVPLYEAKMIHQFDHRWATYDETGTSSFDVDCSQKESPDFEPTPRYWVPKAEVEARLQDKGWNRGWLMGWRDITNATNERTVIASVFPRTGSGDTLLIKMPDVRDSRLYAANLANLCTLVLDYSARQKIGGTHLKYNIFKQLPVLAPDFYNDTVLEFIVPRVLELTYTSHSLAAFAQDLCYDGPPFPWNEDRRALLRAEHPAGPGGPEQGSGHVAGDPEPRAAQPRIQPGQIDAVQPAQCGAARFQRTAVGVEERRTERGEHAGAAVVGGRTAQPDEELLGPPVERCTDQLPHTERAGAQHIPALLGYQFQPGGGGDLDDGELTQRDQSVARGDRVAQRVADLGLDQPPVQRRDHRLDGALPAVGHRDAHALGVRQHLAHPGGHRGDGLGRGHRLLERVGSQHDPHPLTAFGHAVSLAESVGDQRHENALEHVAFLGAQVRQHAALGIPHPGIGAGQQAHAGAGQLGRLRPAGRGIGRAHDESAVLQTAQHHIHRLGADVDVAGKFGVRPSRLLRQDAQANILRESQIQWLQHGRGDVRPQRVCCAVQQETQRRIVRQTIHDQAC